MPCACVLFGSTFRRNVQIYSNRAMSYGNHMRANPNGAYAQKCADSEQCDDTRLRFAGYE